MLCRLETVAQGREESLQPPEPPEDGRVLYVPQLGGLQSRRWWRTTSTEEENPFSHLQGLREQRFVVPSRRGNPGAHLAADADIKTLLPSAQTECRVWLKPEFSNMLPQEDKMMLTSQCLG